jgi:hypothetical protein
VSKLAIFQKAFDDLFCELANEITLIRVLQARRRFEEIESKIRGITIDTDPSELLDLEMHLFEAHADLKWEESGRTSRRISPADVSF